MKTFYSNLLALFTLCSIPFFAGAQWTKPNPGFSQATSIAGISSPNNQVVWLAGRDTSQSVSGHRFARSVDGGQTWSQFSIIGFETYTPSNISALNADTAWVAMYNSVGGGGIFRTNDGGSTWAIQTTAVFAAPAGFPNFVHFFDANNGVCMGDPNGGYFEIYTTTNGGTSWTRVSQPNIPANLTGEYGVVDKFSYSGNSIYFNTSSGRVFCSANKGLNWTTTPITINTDTAYTYWVAAKSATEATAVVYGSNSYQLAKTTNGGLTWSTEPFTGTVQLFRGAYINGGGNAKYLLSFGGNTVQISYDEGKHWAPYSAAKLNNPNSFFEGGIATSPNGNIWLGGRYHNAANPGIMKYAIPKKDVVTPGVIVGANLTSCFIEDTVYALVKNMGTDTILFATTPLTVKYNVYDRLSGLSGYTLNSYFKTKTTGALLPGDSLLIPWKNSPTVFKNYEYYIQTIAALSDSGVNVNFNDTSVFSYFNGILTTSLVSASSGNPASTFYNGESFTLSCTGNFATIQWQDKTPSGSWTNITGANSANYTFSPTESKYYRAMLCGTKFTDSLALMMLDGNAVGFTYYDNQTNGSINNRIQVSGNTVVAAFTGSMDQTNTTTADRGSFSNHANTGIWGTPATSRVESIRTGFPSLAVTKFGKEVIVSHNAATSKLVLSRRNTAGTGNWTETLDFAKGMWPRLVAAEGDTLHLIALDTSVSLGAKIRYYRSSNAGLTWDIAIDLPGYTTAGGFTTTYSESYAIQAYGSTVAIVAGGYNNKLVLWKSSNSGLTWTTKTIKTFPAGFDGNTVLPNTATTDGIMSLLINNGSTVSVFTGKMFLQDDVAGDNSWSYFPNTDGLLYWKDSWPTDSLVEIATAAQTGYVAGGFVLSNNAGLCSYPSATASLNGSMFVTFSVPVNNTGDSITGVSRRDVFGIMSMDGGNTWSVPQNLTRSASSGYDNSFASSANNSNDTIHLLWQSSTTPVARNDGRINLKTILHHPFHYASFESITQYPLSTSNACGNDSITVNFAAVGSFATVSVQLSDINWSFASPTTIGLFTNTNSLVSHKVKIPGTLPSGAYLVRILGASGTESSEQYMINITHIAPKPTITNTRPLTFCSGDSTILTVDTAQIGILNHVWVVNGIIDSLSFNKLKYTVKSTANIQVIVNPAACSTISDTIKVVRNLIQAVTVTLTSDTAVCSGTALTLKAIVLTGTPTSYQWRKNGTTTGTNSPNLVIAPVSATSAGRYTISINSQCAVYNSDTIDVVVNAVPAITQQPGSVTTCDGSTAVFRVRSTSSTPATYQWKKGSQLLATADSLVIQNAAVTDTGAYLCVITNACGATTSQSATLSLTQPLSINGLLPDTLLCKGAAFTYSLSVSGAGIQYKWYKDTTVVGNNATLSFAAISLSDSGSYFLRISNTCGVLVSNISTLSVSEAPTASISVLTGDTLMATITGSYASLAWYLNDSLLSGAEDTLLVAPAGGIYKVRVTSMGGCTNTSAPFEHNTTGLAENSAFSTIHVYPNPANTIVNITGLNAVSGTLMLSDLLGREVFTKEVMPSGMQIDLSTIQPGMYLIQITGPEGSFVRKIQVQH